MLKASDCLSKRVAKLLKLMISDLNRIDVHKTFLKKAGFVWECISEKRVAISYEVWESTKHHMCEILISDTFLTPFI